MRMPLTDEMAAAVAAGTKTETRRLVTEKTLEQYHEISGAAPPWRDDEFMVAWTEFALCADDLLDEAGCRHKRALWKLPRYRPGDVCAVAEALVESEGGYTRYCRDDVAVSIMLDNGHRVAKWWEWDIKTLPARFMPAWAARAWVEVTGVGVERVQEIDEAGAIAEGIECEPGVMWDGVSVAITMYEELWNVIHKKPGTTWEDNPPVWVVRFERTQKPLAADERG